MAEWTNLFDLGECTVKVYDPIDELFSQVMAKGGSATYERFGTNTVSVSATGEVSIVGPDIGAGGNMLAVIPSYPHDYAARIRGAVIDGVEMTLAAGGINTDTRKVNDPPGVNYFNYTAVAPAAPEPLDLSALTGARDGVFLSVGGGG